MRKDTHKESYVRIRHGPVRDPQNAKYKAAVKEFMHKMGGYNPLISAILAIQDEQELPLFENINKEQAQKEA